MTQLPALKQPVTAMVRSFLEDQGVSLKPWTGIDETYAALYSLLYQRRNDDGFWKPLDGLLTKVMTEAMEKSSRGALPAADAELLDRDEIEDLARDLRRAVSYGELEGGASVLGVLGARLSASALAAFVALGLAAGGCSDSGDDSPGIVFGDTDTSDGGVTGEDTETGGAQDAECQGDDYTETCGADVPETLAGTVGASCLVNGDRAALCDCIPGMGQSWREGLAALFENGDAEDVAAALEELVFCCETPEMNDPFSQDYTPAAESALIAGDLCTEAIAIYMAVPFFDK